MVVQPISINEFLFGTSYDIGDCYILDDFSSSRNTHVDEKRKDK